MGITADDIMRLDGITDRGEAVRRAKIANLELGKRRAAQPDDQAAGAPAPPAGADLEPPADPPTLSDFGAEVVGSSEPYPGDGPAVGALPAEIAQAVAQAPAVQRAQPTDDARTPRERRPDRERPDPRREALAAGELDDGEDWDLAEWFRHLPGWVAPALGIAGGALVLIALLRRPALPAPQQTAQQPAQQQGAPLWQQLYR